MAYYEFGNVFLNLSKSFDPLEREGNEKLSSESRESGTSAVVVLGNKYSENIYILVERLRRIL